MGRIVVPSPGDSLQSVSHDAVLAPCFGNSDDVALFAHRLLAVADTHTCGFATIALRDQTASYFSFDLKRKFPGSRTRFAWRNAVGCVGGAAPGRWEKRIHVSTYDN